jgi:hypothetical protein
VATARGLHGAPVFGRDSAVRDYWLAHAAGFEIRRGRSRLGHVEDVVVDADLGRTTALVVRSPRRRRSTVVPVQRVAAVDPLVRLFYLERPDRVRTTLRAGTAAAGRTASAVAAASRWSVPHARRAALAGYTGSIHTWTAGARSWSRLRPHVVKAAGRAAAATARTSRRLRPAAVVLAGRLAVWAARLTRAVAAGAGHGLDFTSRKVFGLRKGAGTKAQGQTPTSQGEHFDG